MARRVAAVTGATGFLASELVAQLLGRGFAVRATVRSLADASRLACLRELPGADGQLTLLEANLLDDGAFDKCMSGADLVYHTASPFVTKNVSDPQAELFAPSLEGTRNVFRSIVRSVESGGAKPRVVLTSSVAALFGMSELTERALDAPFHEDDWNASSTAEGNPPGDGLDLYRYSKVIAEREAWRLADAHGLQLATVLPSFIVGPPRTPRLDGESISNMRMALEGEMPHRADTPMADVRDVATAHVEASLRPEAAGKRFLTSSPRAMTRAALLILLRDRYPELELADAGPAPDPAGLREMFRSTNLHLLGVAMRSPEESLLDMAEAMLAHGLVKTRPRAA